MLDWLTDWLLGSQNSLWLMFTSAFLSATVLPGNSEIIFLFLTAPLIGTMFSNDVLNLIAVATVGNTLGSMTTYVIGRWFPKLEQKNLQRSWALDKIQRYGIWTLLLSWLPIVGDAFCAMAGWLRFNCLKSMILIFFSKLLRYVFLYQLNILTY
ncbi:DedA family protein [Avibacterium sp. 21-586]|uniref:YqaA family protein n=1 Tax=Avibacterium sp. 21-586 TaxID=2911534 RepID=UPI002247E4F2|nr:YqaA family protein [Avibacterium sp. 21-586]MCW9710355.1 DedA family protein [Avibacterium sp. 21-586]